MAIPLYWWDDQPNFGDALSPLIVSHVAQREVRQSKSPEKLLAVGSILGFAARENDVVWGSGLLWPGPLPKGLRVAAVRGPMTREVLLRQQIDCPDVYGDPAWLMPDIYCPVIEKRYKTAVLPHHADQRLQRAGIESGAVMLSVADPPLEVIDGILAAERLVTSSLHGLIIAETYGVPVALLRERARKNDQHFKFVDYFQSTGRPDLTLEEMSIDEAIKKIPEMPRPEPIDAEKLVAAFPLAECRRLAGEI